MIHVEDGALQALIDGELEPAARADAERHLAECPRCAAELEGLRALAALPGTALAAADRPVQVEAARRAVLRRGPAVRFAMARGALLRAAALVLGMAGVAAATVPGSPVGRWIREAVAPSAPEEAPAPPARAAPPAAAPEAPRVSGVAVLPSDGGVRVVLSGAAPGLRLVTRDSDGDRLEVSAEGAASVARFRTGPGRIEVVGPGAGTVTVTLPRAATVAVIEIDGTVYLTRDGGRTRLLVEPAQRTGAETVFRVGA